MDLIIVRHAESQSNASITENLDSSLTDVGVAQACTTGMWVYNNFILNDYVGFTTPYMRGLQTASVISELTGVGFAVDSALREFRFKNSCDVKIINRSILFQNIKWPLQEWTDDITFKAEDVDEFIDRSMEFLCRCKETQKKILVVTHGAPAAMLIRLASGKSVEEIKNECMEVQNVLTSDISKATMVVDNSLFFTGLKNCGITWIRDDKIIFLSKVAYE